MFKSQIGKIHSFESFGTVDGPGVRYVTFMQGCPFRCLYCHNPDTIDPTTPSFKMTAKELFKKIEPMKNYYRSGGVTLSGGEPLLQAKFVREFFQICKDNGMHRTLDTAGIQLTEEVKKALELTDLVLLDIKCIDPDIHKWLTGRPLGPTLTFAKYLEEKNIPVWIRYVIVPGITDDEELVTKHADFVASLKNVEMVEILPFHKMGLAKYEQMGIEYPLKDTPTPTKKSIENVKKIYEERGLKVK